jgi:hypothetical protein
MATFFDFALLREFSSIFTWVLIFVVVYGVLEVTNFLHNRGLHAIMAITLTVLVSISGVTTNVVTSLAPWFVIIAFFLFFFFSLTSFMGIEKTGVLSVLGNNQAFWWVFVPLIIALVVALINAGQQGGELSPLGDLSGSAQATQEPVSAGKVVLDTLTDKKVLGMMLIFSISAVTIALMTGGGGAVAKVMTGGH